MRLTSALLLSLAFSACVSSPRPLRLVSPRELPEASAAPRAVAVRDIGAPGVAGDRLPLLPPSDGRAVIGELLLVSGENFGRRPRVMVDGRSTALLARTADGGVIVRVPWGVRVGRRRVEVVTSHGRAAAGLLVVRYALATVPSKDAIYPLRLEAAGIERGGKPLKVPGARFVRFSAHGQVAFVSGRRPSGELTVTAVALTGQRGPRVLKSYPIPGKRMVGLATAARGPLGLAVSDSHFVFFDCGNPQAPASYRPLPLPEDLVGGLLSVDLDPSGSLMALLMATGNTLMLFDTKDPSKPRRLAATRVLPEKVPLVRGLQFAGDSTTVWVISGPTGRTTSRYPLRLTVIKIGSRPADGDSPAAFGVLSVWRSLDVPHRAAPVDLAVARGQPLATGATVAVPPENAAVFITAHDAKLLRLRQARLDRKRGLRRAVRVLRGITPLGTVIRTDLSGHGGPMYTSPSLLGSIDITSDSQLLLVAGARVESRRRPAQLRLSYGVSSCRVFGKRQPRFLPLAEVDPDTLARPFMLGDVRVQP